MTPTPLRPQFSFKVFLNLIRALFPKWSFFDRIASHFHLEFKIPGVNEWTPISFEQNRKFFGLFINHECNLALAEVNIIEHFAQDVQELQMQNPRVHSKEVQRLSTFKMLSALLQYKLKKFELEADQVQFKISAVSPSEEIVIYISDWIGLKTK